METPKVFRNKTATAKLKGEFFAAATSRGIAHEPAQQIWGVLAGNRAWYCKAHAVGYGVTVFQAAYLKTYYPKAFDASTSQ